MSDVRVKILSSSITEQVVPTLLDGEFAHKLEKDRVFYLHEPKSDFGFYGAGYTLINGLEDECEEITIKVERKCGGTWFLHWQGVFTKFDCKIDPQRCIISAKATQDSLYQCLFKEWEVNEIVYGAGSVIRTKEFFGTYESYQYCQECRPTLDLDPVCTEANWCERETVEIQTGGHCEDPDPFSIITWFHRIVATGTAIDPPPYSSGWTLLSGTTWWRCPSGESLQIGSLNQGRRFDAVLNFLVSQTGCGLTARSHFFNIAATHAAAPDNDAYDYAEISYRNMTVHQKSDVKRPDGDPSFSYVWKMNLKDLLADLQKIFNVFWRIDGTDLIIEHASYFEAEEGEDYSAVEMPLRYEYDGDTPREEKFIWSDEECSDDFAGSPILYNCGGDRAEVRATLFSTDVAFIRDIENQDKISDDKWVLVSNEKDGSTYFIKDRNEPLSWTILHDKLHRHRRPFATGTLNGDAVTFLSTRPIKKQPEFVVTGCCDAAFDPSKYITTPLGIGRIQVATENIFKDTLKIQANYE